MWGAPIFHDSYSIGWVLVLGHFRFSRGNRVAVLLARRLADGSQKLPSPIANDLLRCALRPPQSLGIRQEVALVGEVFGCIEYLTAWGVQNVCRSSRNVPPNCASILSPRKSNPPWAACPPWSRWPRSLACGIKSASCRGLIPACARLTVTAQS